MIPELQGSLGELETGFKARLELQFVGQHKSPGEGLLTNEIITKQPKWNGSKSILTSPERAPGTQIIVKEVTTLGLLQMFKYLLSYYFK